MLTVAHCAFYSFPSLSLLHHLCLPLCPPCPETSFLLRFLASHSFLLHCPSPPSPLLHLPTALFRRGVAHNKGGSLDEAEADLRRVLLLDTTNAAASKELVDVLRKQKEHKQSEKKAFSSMFAKSMYADKEAERHAKAKREEAERQKEQDDWTKSKLDRRSKGLEEQTFEDWKKEIEEERKKDKDKADLAPSPPSPPTTTSKPKPKVEPQDNDEEEYDAEESQIIAETTKKGYCYFRNELSSETKSLIGDITPKVVAELPPSSAIGQHNISAGGDSSSEKIAASSWNTAGTWEERECTQQAEDRLTALCLEAQVSSSDHPATMTAEGGGLDSSSLSSVLDALSSSGTDKGAQTTAALEKLEIALATLRASVTGATSVTGDAHIVMARGKKRHIYDFNVILEFEVEVIPPSTPGLSSSTIDNPDTGIKPKRFKGTFTLPEVVPSAESDGAGLEIAMAFKKPIPSNYTDKVHNIAELLKDRVTGQIIAFENEFKSM